MKPSLKEGSIIIYKRFLRSELKDLKLKKGDIIIFLSPQTEVPIAHRVVSVNKSKNNNIENIENIEILTRGDSFRETDGVIDLQRLVGVVLNQNRLIRVPVVGRIILGCLGYAYYFLFRRMNNILMLIIKLCYPFIPIKTIAVRDRLSSEKVIATLGRKLIGKKVIKGDSEDIWVHPLFKRTNLRKKLDCEAKLDHVR